MIDRSPFDWATVPTISLAAFLFQLFVALVLLRPGTGGERPRGNAPMAGLFLLNAVAGLIGFAGEMAVDPSPWFGHLAYAVDAGTGPMLLAFLAMRLHHPAARGFAWAAASLGGIHALLIVAGAAANPDLLRWIIHLDPWLRASPLFAAWTITVMWLSGGDRADRWISLAWGVRAATWGVHGPQRLWIQRAEGLPHDLETIWLTVLLLSVFVAAFRLRRPHGGPDPVVAWALLGGGVLLGLGEVVAIGYGRVVFLDQWSVWFLRGALVLVALAPGVGRLAFGVLAPTVALATALFHGLRTATWYYGIDGTGFRGPAAILWAASLAGTVLVVMTQRRSEHAAPGLTDAALGMAPGLLVGRRYRIKEALGDRGTATAYRAVDTRTRKEVVVKSVGAGLGAREAQALAAVDAPGVVGLRDHVLHGGMSLLVTEYLPGGSLRQQLDSGATIPVDDLAHDLLGALAHLHAAGVVHGDIKPSNIAYDAHGRGHLIDLGASRWPAEEATMTTGLSGVPLGTPQYMAPEVAAGQRPDEASDVWCAAAVLWESCAGYPYRPRTGLDDLATLLRRAAIQGDHVPQPAWPKPRNEWFHAALHPEPRQRFQTASEALAAWPIGETDSSL